MADDFSLRERGIDMSRLAHGVKPGAIDLVIDHMAEGRKVLACSLNSVASESSPPTCSRAHS